MSFPYLNHCLCSIARGFAGVGGVDLAWLGMLTEAFGLAPSHVEMVFALLLLVYSIQELSQCVWLNCVLKDNGALGTGTRGFGIQAREVPSHLI